MQISWTELPDVTILIRRSQSGDPTAEERLYRLVYPHLKDLASRMIRRHGDEDMLSPLDLVHDVYVGRLKGWKGAVADRGHYIAFVTNAMRNELIDQARRAKAQKRSRPSELQFPLTHPSELTYEVILALEQEIEGIERADWRAAHVVRLRYYAGCSWEETAAAVDATIKMVRNDWEFASEWLKKRLGRRRF